MRRIFVDTNYFVAILNRNDRLHDVAIRRRRELGDGAIYVTLLAHLTEVLAYASGGNEQMRFDAARFVDRIRSSPEYEVIDGDRALFDEGLELYRRRLDKSYSHVDCMAMAVCKREKITEVLTGDRDFEREGFTILL